MNNLRNANLLTHFWPFGVLFAAVETAAWTTATSLHSHMYYICERGLHHLCFLVKDNDPIGLGTLILLKEANTCLGGGTWKGLDVSQIDWRLRLPSDYLEPKRRFSCGCSVIYTPRSLVILRFSRMLSYAVGDFLVYYSGYSIYIIEFSC